MSASTEIKSIQSRLSSLRAEMDELKRQADQHRGNAREIDAKVRKKQSMVGQLESRYKALTRGAPKVSEHALLRYLERGKGVDMDEIKKEIERALPVDAIKELGDGKYPIGNGLRAVVKENVVLTVAKK